MDLLEYEDDGSEDYKPTSLFNITASESFYTDEGSLLAQGGFWDDENVVLNILGIIHQFFFFFFFYIIFDTFSFQYDCCFD
jgi:hypothetical protein